MVGMGGWYGGWDPEKGGGPSVRALGHIGFTIRSVREGYFGGGFADWGTNGGVGQAVGGQGKGVLSHEMG